MFREAIGNVLFGALLWVADHAHDAFFRASRADAWREALRGRCRAAFMRARANGWNPDSDDDDLRVQFWARLGGFKIESFEHEWQQGVTR
jgi:hypothetical protein